MKKEMEFIEISIRVPRVELNGVTIDTNTSSEKQAADLDGWVVQFSNMCPKHGTAVLLLRRDYKPNAVIQADDFQCQVETVLQLAEGVARGTEGGIEVIVANLFGPKEPPMDPRLQ